MFPQRRPPLPTVNRLTRAFLRLELLEDRWLLSVRPGLDVSHLPLNRPYLHNEVIASIDAAQPLPELTAEARGPLTSQIDWQTTRRLYGRGGVATVEVGLNPGIDPVQVVRELDQLPAVAWASPDFVYDNSQSGSPADFVPDDPDYSLQYHHPLMQNDRAWDITTGDPRIIIAVTDSGVALDHEDLYGNIWINQGEIPPSRLKNLVDVDGDGIINFRDLNDPINQGPFKITDVNGDGRIDASDLLAPMDVDSKGNDLGTGGWATGQDKDGNGFVDDIVGWNFASSPESNDPNPQRNSPAPEHGTHVAGIAGAMIDNGVGVAGTAGGATIMPIRFYGNVPWTASIIARSYAYATDNGARIVSTSYNVDQFVGDPVFEDGLDYMYAGGVLHFNSSGNNSMENPPRARYDQSLYVDATDRNDHKASYSNYGYTTDISAPGDNIFSTFPPQFYNPPYGYDSGTSMATPNAAGVAALIWSLHPDWTREQVVAQLEGTADNIDDLNPTQCRGSCTGKLGAGRVDSYRALTETLAPPRLGAIHGLPDEGGSTSDAIASFQVDIASVLDPASVGTGGNWEIREAGPDGLFDTDDDVVMPLAPDNGYMVGTNRLNFTLPEALPPGHYQFRAYAGGLTDPFGTALDGDGTGQAGTNFIREFYVTGASPSPSGRHRSQDLGTALTGSAFHVAALSPEPIAVAPRSLDSWTIAHVTWPTIARLTQVTVENSGHTLPPAPNLDQAVDMLPIGDSVFDLIGQ